MGSEAFSATGVGRVLAIGGTVLRLGLLNVLTLFHEVVLAVTSAVAFAVFWITIFFKAFVPSSHWSFWEGIALSAGSLLVYLCYAGLIKLLAR